MDLKDLLPKSDTVDVTLVHPVNREVLHNEDGSPMTITMFAPHSKAYRELMYDKADERLKLATETDGKFNVTARAIDEASLDILSRATKEWNITFDGKKPKVSDAKKIYEEVFWIRPQLEAAMEAAQNFT